MTIVLIIFAVLYVYTMEVPAKSQQPKVGKTAKKHQFHFNWPIPCKVKVTEKTEKKGTRAIMQYHLVAKKHKGNQIVVDLKNFVFLEINGQNATTPQMKKQLAPVLATTSSQPTLVIAPDGQLVEIVGLEAVAEKTLALMKKIGKYSEDDPAWKSTVAMIKSPKMAEMIKNKSADYWQSWVGAWVGLELAPAESVETITSLPFPDGSSIETPLVYYNHGAQQGSPTLVRLTASSVLEGPQARAAMLRFFENLSKSASQKPGTKKFTKSMLKEFKRESTISVITDPANLRPAKAEIRSITTIHIQGEGRKQQREIREYTFHWSTEQ